ncbi:hypothetical protein Lal_00033410 [Lupinus albus]|nr:hypothetical protein Lal_00033410 [Lupinus albus]
MFIPQSINFSSERGVEDNSNSKLDNETITLLVRKFRKFLKRKGGLKSFQKKEAKNSTVKGKNSKEHLSCHECGKTSHMKYQCTTYLKKVEG